MVVYGLPGHFALGASVFTSAFGGSTGLGADAIDVIGAAGLDAFASDALGAISTFLISGITEVPLLG